MPRQTRSLNYRSYLLRVWRDDSQKAWRASLQSTHDEQLNHFVNLEALYVHLLTQLSGSVDDVDDSEDVEVVSSEDD